MFLIRYIVKRSGDRYLLLLLLYTAVCLMKMIIDKIHTFSILLLNTLNLYLNTFYLRCPTGYILYFITNIICDPVEYE